MRALTIPLTETIGVKGGVRKDGVLVGKNPAIDITKAFKRSKIITNGRFFTEDVTGQTSVFVDVSTAANNDTIGDVDMFPTAPTIGDAFYSCILKSLTANEVHYFISTAGFGITLEHEYWDSSTEVWTALSGVVATNFLTVTGINVFKFTAPSNWGNVLISGFYGKVIRHRITAVSSPVSPKLTRVYPVSTTHVNTEITNDLKDPSYAQLASYIVEGDEVCIASPEKPWGYEFIYKDAQEGGGTDEFTYSTASEEKALTVTDTSNNYRTKNERTFKPKNLVATAANATVTTVQVIAEHGYIEAAVAAIPTATTNKFSIGLSAVTTGTVGYELRADFVSSNPRLTVYEGGVLKYTHTVNLVVNDVLRVFCLDGASDDTKNLILYYLNGSVIYTSETTEGNSLYGRVIGQTSGVQIKQMKYIDFSDLQALPISVTFQSVTSMTVTDETQITEQLFARHYVKFVAPNDFVSITAANSHIGVDGFQYCRVKRGVITKPTSYMRARLLTMGNTKVKGLKVVGDSTYTGFKFCSGEVDAIESDSILMLFNKQSGATAQIDLPKGTQLLEATINITYQDGNEMLITQVKGDNESDIGIGSYIMLGEAR